MATTNPSEMGSTEPTPQMEKLAVERRKSLLAQKREA